MIDPVADRPESLRGLSRRNSIYRHAIEVCDDLADAALTGCGPDELTEVFAGRVGKRVVLLDPLLRARAQSGAGDAFAGLPPVGVDPTVDRLIAALRSGRRPMRIPAVPGSSLERACLVAPVAVRDTTLGYLLVLDDRDGAEPDDADLLTVTYAATLFALTLAHERTSAELDLQRRSAVLDELVSGQFLDATDAVRKAASLGLRIGTALRVGVIHLARPPDLRTIEALAHRVSGRAAGAVVGARGSAIVAITPDVAALTALPPRASPEPQPTVGLSDPFTAVEQAPEAFRQAETAIAFGERLGRGGQTIRYADLGIYRLLLEIGDLSRLGRFADDVLGPLLAHDATHPQDLVGTLSVYLRTHASLKQTARALQLHPNTVAYRAQRIQQITGLDLADAEDRLMAHVAVKIVEALRAQAKGQPSIADGWPPAFGGAG